MRWIDLAVIVALSRWNHLVRSAIPHAPNDTLKDYFLGGKNVPWWAIALSIVSAETSTLTVIGTPALSFQGNFGFLASRVRLPAGAHRDRDSVSAGLFSRRNVHRL